MSLTFVTLSFEHESSYSCLKKINKLYKDGIRMLVKEYGKKDTHLHYHLIIELPMSLASHTSQFCKKISCQSPHGVKIKRNLSSKEEMYYVGYLQKEIKQALPIDIFDKRVYTCDYGKKYLEKAWLYYKSNPLRHKTDIKDSFDGTMLARKIYSEYNFKGYESALNSVYLYSMEHNVDIRRPDTIANMMCQIKRMEKQKNMPTKKI